MSLIVSTFSSKRFWRQQPQIAVIESPSTESFPQNLHLPAVPRSPAHAPAALSLPPTNFAKNRCYRAPVPEKFLNSISVHQRRAAVKKSSLSSFASVQLPIRVNPCNPWLKNPFPFSLPISGNQRRLAVKKLSAMPFPFFVYFVYFGAAPERRTQVTQDNESQSIYQ